MHFFFFLFDILLWSVLGSASGYKIGLLERGEREIRLQLAGSFGVVAVLIGLWESLTKGLPDVGPAFANTVAVCLGIIALSLITSPRLRGSVQTSPYWKQTIFSLYLVSIMIRIQLQHAKP